MPEIGPFWIVAILLFLWTRGIAAAKRNRERALQEQAEQAAAASGAEEGGREDASAALPAPTQAARRDRLAHPESSGARPGAGGAGRDEAPVSLFDQLRKMANEAKAASEAGTAGQTMAAMSASPPEERVVEVRERTRPGERTRPALPAKSPGPSGYAAPPSYPARREPPSYPARQEPPSYPARQEPARPSGRRHMASSEASSESPLSASPLQRVDHYPIPQKAVLLAEILGPPPGLAHQSDDRRRRDPED